MANEEGVKSFAKQMMLNTKTKMTIMKNIFKIIVISFLFISCGENKKEIEDRAKVLADSIVKSQLQFQDSINSNKDSISSKTELEPSEQSGTVICNLCYPSDAGWVPALKVFLKNVETGDERSLITKDGEEMCEFENVPDGKYVAYAYNEEYAIGGGFTPAVACGLEVTCTDHKLINFNVEKGGTSESIKICDWYGAILPGETAITNSVNADEYFQFKAGTKYTYNSLGVDGNGKMQEMSYECYSVENKGGTTVGLFYKMEFGIQAQQKYETKGNIIQMTYDKNKFSGGQLNSPIIIFKLPENNMQVKWSLKSEEFYEATYVSSVTTSTKTYTDCVLVTKTTKIASRPEYKPVTKNYYAKGVGLVKTDFYDSTGKLVKMASFELISIYPKRI